MFCAAAEEFGFCVDGSCTQGSCLVVTLWMSSLYCFASADWRFSPLEWHKVCPSYQLCYTNILLVIELSSVRIQSIDNESFNTISIYRSRRFMYHTFYIVIKVTKISWTASLWNSFNTKNLLRQQVNQVFQSEANCIKSNEVHNETKRKNQVGA